MRYKKRRVLVSVSFAKEHGSLDTLEGRIEFEPGDAIVTATTNERWVVSRDRFDQMYEPDQTSSPWKDGMYWKKAEFVSATQQTEKFRVVIDGGILHGNCGDWLIEDGRKFKWVVSDVLFRNSYELVESEL